MTLYRTAAVLFSIAFLAIGLVLIARTAAAGGGVVGFLVGGLFVGLGAARLALERRRP